METGGIEHRIVQVNGINMHVAEKGEGPVVLFIHGFPELWYSWRHQIAFIASHGYRAVAPDLRGFGDTDSPSDVASFTIFHLVGDLIDLINSLGQDKIPGTWSTEAEFARLGATSAIRKFLTYHEPAPILISKEKGFGGSPNEEVTLPSWLSEDDISYFANKCNKSGFTGGLNYYRNLNSNWELTAPWTEVQIKVPVKFVVGDQDLSYHVHRMQEYIHKGGFKRDAPFLQEVVVMEGVGHFITQERPNEISQHILEFISRF